MQTIFLNFTLMVLYFVTGLVSFDFFVVEKIVTVGIFIPEGIALAFALYYGKRVLVGIFLGQFVLALFNHLDFVCSLEIALVNTAEAALGIYLVQHFKINIALKTIRDVAGLFMLVIFILQPLSAFFGNLVLILNNALVSSFAISLFSWWFGNVMGQLLVTPFLLLLFTQWRSLHLREFFLYGFVFFVYVYLLEILFDIGNVFLLLSLILPVVIFVMEKKGMLYGSLLSLLAMLVSEYAVYLGKAAFFGPNNLDNIINFNLFVLANILTVMLVGEVLKIVGEMLNSYGIVVAFENFDRHRCLCYKNEMQQVLLILINNAKEALMHTQRDKGLIRFSIDKRGEDLSLSVCDNAFGVPPEIETKIFDPYFTTKEKATGKGIGLYMAKMLVEESLGGSLTLHNSKEGACFEIVFPHHNERNKQ